MADFVATYTGERQPWERREGESSRAHAAFCIYLDMGPKRSLREAARRYYQDKCRANVGQIWRWSRRWNWVARCEAWDDYQDKLARERQTEEIQAMRDRQAKLGVGMQGVAAQGLKAFRPEEATAHDIVRLAAEGTKIERLARGEVTEIAEVKQETTLLDLVRKAKEQMTDEELERIASQG
jgi:hypothetical protein